MERGHGLAGKNIPRKCHCFRCHRSPLGGRLEVVVEARGGFGGGKGIADL